MDPQDKSPTLIVHEESDSLEELSEYLDVLSSSARLRILKFLEKKPRDARAISKEIETSYENTKKHLDKLLSIGVIKKEAGLGAPTSKGIHPVWQYSLVPGGMEVIVRNLGLFTHTRFPLVGNEISRRLDEVKGTISKEVLGNEPAVIILGGPDDSRVFRLQQDIIRIGRFDPENVTAFRTDTDVVFSEAYTAVTRVSKPHGQFTRKNGVWYIEDCGSTGGTQVNNQKAEKGSPVLLHDGDLIELAKGVSGIRLLMILPKKS